MAIFLFVPHTELFSASLRISKDNCGFCLERLNHSEFFTPFKISESFLGSSKIYSKLSSITGFVHEPRTFADVDRGNRWNSKWLLTSKDAT